MVNSQNFDELYEKTQKTVRIIKCESTLLLFTTNPEVFAFETGRRKGREKFLSIVHIFVSQDANEDNLLKSIKRICIPTINGVIDWVFDEEFPLPETIKQAIRWSMAPMIVISNNDSKFVNPLEGRKRIW